MKLPGNIFLVGAAKAGTTKLADMLDLHPSICLAKTKEPDYYSNKIFNDRNDDWYDSQFLDQKAVRLDASTSYSMGWGGSSENIAKRIVHYNPNCQLIYIYRDPATRAWSSYWHSVRAGSEKRKYEEALVDLDCQHFQASRYLARMDEYSKHVPLKNIHILRFEDFIKFPTEYARALLKRLELEDFEYDTYQTAKKENESYTWGSSFGFVKLLPFELIQKINSAIKACFPKSFHAFLKRLLSKPVEKLPAALKSELTKKFEKELNEFETKYSDNIIKLDK